MNFIKNTLLFAIFLILVAAVSTSTEVDQKSNYPEQSIESVGAEATLKRIRRSWPWEWIGKQLCKVAGCRCTYSKGYKASNCCDTNYVWDCRK